MSTDLSSAYNDETLPPVRSTFLTVLCILTFIGSAYGIFSGVSTILTADKIVAMTKKNTEMQQQQKVQKELRQKNDAGSKFALKIMDSAGDFLDVTKIKNRGAGDIAANILTLVGAVLMWRQRRTGFFVYVAGCVTSVAVPLAIFGTNNFLAILGALIPGFFGLVFIVLYAFNLKDMKQVGTMDNEAMHN